MMTRDMRVKKSKGSNRGWNRKWQSRIPFCKTKLENREDGNFRSFLWTFFLEQKDPIISEKNA